MRMRVHRGVTIVGMLAVLATACQGAGDGSPADTTPSTPPTASATAPTAPATVDVDAVEDCPGLAVALVDALQQYVDSFAGVTAEGVPQVAEATGADLQTVTADLRGRAEELGCDAATMGPLVRDELDRLEADSPVQEAVVQTLRSDPLGTLDPSDPDPVTLTVSTADQLLRALANVGSGSTIQLDAGTYELDDTLVPLRPVTIEGAGAEDTVLRSSAPGAAVVVATDGDVHLGGLTVEHVGDDPASVVVVHSGGYQLEDLAVRGGTADDDGAGGFGVLLSQAATLLTDPAPADGRTVRDVHLENNEGGGILVAGPQEPSLSEITVAGTGGCGVCWIGRAAGTLTTATITGQQTGVRVEESAHPTVVGVAVEDAGVGVALVGSGTTRVRDVTVSGTGEAGIIVAEQARPELRGGDLAVEGEVGLMWLGEAAGSADDLTIRTSRIGVQVDEDAAPTLRDLAIEQVGDLAVVATGSSGGTLDGCRCDGTDTGVIALLEDTSLTVTGEDTCEVVDDRDGES